MNGDINVTSKVDVGTKVIFNIICEISEEKIIIRKKSSLFSSKIDENFKFLIVEDIKINQDILSHFLKKINPNFEIEFADNGKIGLNKILSKIETKKLTNCKFSSFDIYDIIFMDFFMPIMNGIESAIEIRKLEKIYNFKFTIIGVTGFFETKKAETLFDKIIQKPFSVNDIFNEIEKYLKFYQKLKNNLQQNSSVDIKDNIMVINDFENKNVDNEEDQIFKSLLNQRKKNSSVDLNFKFENKKIENKKIENKKKIESKKIEKKKIKKKKKVKEKIYSKIFLFCFLFLCISILFLFYFIFVI
jgi:CheY-like chemotaxis protein